MLEFRGARGSLAFPGRLGCRRPGGVQRPIAIVLVAVPTLLAPRCLYFTSCLRLGFLFLCLLLLLPPPRLLPLPADGGHGILILVVLPVILRPLYRR